LAKITRIYCCLTEVEKERGQDWSLIWERERRGGTKKAQPSLKLTNREKEKRYWSR